MIWPFKRRARPVADRRDGVAWMAGDLAVCILDMDDWCGEGDFLIPERGAVHRVIHVREYVCEENPTGRPVLAQWLRLEELSPNGHYESRAFRKAVQDHDACEEEFRIAMRNLIKGPVA